MPDDTLPATEDVAVERELDFLLAACARTLVKSANPAAFLDWIAGAGPQLAPGMAVAVDPRVGTPALFFRTLGVGIYNAMPLPVAGFRTRSLPKPGRNEPCHCGSGRKFKQCCLALGEAPDFRQFNLLRYVLDALPKAAFASLPGSGADALMVADTAAQWRDAGGHNRAIALLEPWFTGDHKLPGRLEPLFDLLMDCYLELGKSKKRKHLVGKMLARGERQLRAAALRRQVTMLADQGEHAAAWTVLHQAQREDTENPALAMLEITLLMSQGDTGQMRERAAFWLARLRHRRDIDPGYLALLQDVAENPAAAFAGLYQAMHPALGHLAALFDKVLAQAPARHYRVESTDAGNYLLPADALAAVETTWHMRFTPIKPALIATQHEDAGVWEEAERWLRFLEQQPLAWHSLDVLDDLVMAVDALPGSGSDQDLLKALLRRGLELLEFNLAAAGAERQILPWPFMENRPALRLLAHQAWLLLEQDVQDPAFIQAAERLLTLNPDDNHGVRLPLSRAWLEHGEPDKVLALAARYPDDLCELCLNRLLALYWLGRRGEALTLLNGEAARHHVALDMLLAERPRQPRVSERSITVGGKDEAWLYRSEHRHLWERQGALDWLAQAWRQVMRRR
jgi:hypothetical protein